MAGSSLPSRPTRRASVFGPQNFWSAPPIDFRPCAGRTRHSPSTDGELDDKNLSKISQLDQRKRGPLEIEGVNGLMDCGIEGIGVGEGLMREMMRLEVAPDGFDVV